jgi:hypothetical protein
MIRTGFPIWMRLSEERENSNAGSSNCVNGPASVTNIGTA